MSDDLTVSTPDLALVALNPAEIAPAQAALAQWCLRKVQDLGRELREQRENLRLAKLHKWRHSGWSNAVSRTQRRMSYYVKIKKAVEAGYLIVPNFPVEIMAVRVNQPPASIQHGYRNIDITDDRAPALPPGLGRYVSNRLETCDVSHEEPDPTQPGKRRIVRRYQPSGYQAPEFPVRAIKPIVLEAAQRAMALRLFDRIGIVTGRKQDPVVVGQIQDPIKKWRQISFFIAWWLNTEDL